MHYIMNKVSGEIHTPDCSYLPAFEHSVRFEAENNVEAVKHGLTINKESDGCFHCMNDVNTK